ncbi:Uncharacterized protein dnl_18370 [Desulfonema limicola]|uniref:Uncharacterized protein n=1 Tax=Desulfonema limicola TaxID=45656 RepID=A0A975B683_9BACT|nr:Uncharacterized protein dnl_18370 [Desulfonema limicola]
MFIISFKKYTSPIPDTVKKNHTGFTVDKSYDTSKFFYVSLS